MTMVLAQMSQRSAEFQLTWALYSMAFNGLIGGIVGYFKNRVFLGFILGALLSCIGWIIMGFMDKKRLY